MELTAKQRGVLAVLLSSILWGIEPILGKLAAVGATSSLQTTFFRTVVALGVAGIYFSLHRQPLSIPKGSRWPLLVMSLSSGVCADLLYYTAVSMTSAVNTVVLSHLQPVGVILLGTVIWRHERLSLADCIGAGLMLLSALVVTAHSFEALREFKFGATGDLLILIATLFWSLSTIITKYYILDTSPTSIALARFLISSLVFLPLVIARQEFFIVDILPLALGVTTGIGMLLYFYALQQLKAAQTSSLELAATFFAAAFGYIFLAEPVSWFQCFGILGLVGGVYLLSKHDGAVTPIHTSSATM